MKCHLCYSYSSLCHTVVPIEKLSPFTRKVESRFSLLAVEITLTGKKKVVSCVQVNMVINCLLKSLFCSLCHFFSIRMQFSKHVVTMNRLS